MSWRTIVKKDDIEKLHEVHEFSLSEDRCHLCRVIERFLGKDVNCSVGLVI